MGNNLSPTKRLYFILFKNGLSFSLYIICLTVSYVLFAQSVTLVLAQGEKKYSKQIQQKAKILSQTKDPKARKAAAKFLGYHNTSASILALAHALIEDQDPQVRQTAASSLWGHAPKIEAARKALFQSLDDPFPGVRVRSSWALQNMGIDSAELIFARRSALTDRSSTVTTKFWAAFGLIGHEPPTLLAEHLLNYAKPLIRSKAADKAFKLLVKQKNRTVIDIMEQAVESYHKGNTIILKALQEFSPQPQQLIDLICLQFDFPDRELHIEILALLRNQGKIEEEVKKWLPKARPYLSDNDAAAGSMAIAAMTRAGGLAAAAVPDLVLLMENSSNTRLKENAIEAIGAIGDRNKPYPEQLKQNVADQAMSQLKIMMRSEKDRSTRQAAVRALDKLKTDPARVVPAFISVANQDKDHLVKIAALSALGARGKDAKAAIGDLEKLTKNSHPAISRSAKDALTMIRNDYNRAGKTLQPSSSQESKAQQEALATLRSSDASFDENGFMLALNNNQIEKVQAYLDSGVSVNYRFANTQNRPAMNEVFARAASYIILGQGTPKKLKDVVRLMLTRGADPNLVDKMGNTALMMAAMACDAETLGLLLDGGAKLNTVNKAGLTALEFTFMYANPGAEQLLAAGARISKTNAEKYLQAYGNNAKAVKLIKRAAQP